MKTTIAILTGGASSEREVALSSAKKVLASLPEKYASSVYDLPADESRFLAASSGIDAVIPVFHGRGGEDGSVQRWLDGLGVSYIFSRPEAHALGIDKPAAKKAVSEVGLRSPFGVVVSSAEACRYRGPSAIKPLDGGSSIGVSIVRDEASFGEALAAAIAAHGRALVEDYIAGDEYTVLVADTPGGTKPFPVIAIRPKTAFFDFASKYDGSLVDEICPAPIGDALAAALRESAVKAHQAIGARHVSRSDFIVDAAGKIWFLEINTIPGMTPTSLIHKALAASGVRFGDLLEYWIESV